VIHLFKQKQFGKLFKEIRGQLLDLIELVSIKIDVSYILEELEEIEYKIKKLDINNTGLADEVKRVRIKLYNKYKNDLATYLPDKKAQSLIKTIESWIKQIINLY